MIDVGQISYGIGAGIILLLLVYLLFSWREHLDHVLLTIATLITLAWSAVAAYQSGRGGLSFSLYALEILRDLAWVGFLLQLLNMINRQPAKVDLFIRIAVAIGLFSLILLSYATFVFSTKLELGATLRQGASLLFVGNALLALGGILAIENLCRNVDVERRKRIKYLCLGLGGLFAYDLFIYGSSIALGRIDPDVFYARGLVNALVVPFIFLSIRSPLWSKEIFVSHGMVFYAITAVLLGLSLLLLGVGVQYIEVNGRDWARVSQLVLLAGAVLGLLTLLYSERLRANLKIFISKNFFRYKYDYREEWLRFIRILSRGGAGAHLLERALQALTQIVDSSAGLLWLRAESGHFNLAANIGLEDVSVENVPADGSLVHFLEIWQWVINLDEYESEPNLYKELDLPAWMLAIPGRWLVVPLMQDVQLLGFVLVAQPLLRRKINWEDHDLLKTAGRQAATHLAQMMAAKALMDAREFYAFSRLSAFVMHDLKNVVAQLSLVVSNSEKHKHNPDFFVDAIKTVEHSVVKMNRLLGQLRKGQAREKAKLNLLELLSKVVEDRSEAKPVPELTHTEDAVVVHANEDQLSAVLEHIIQNAQEATPMDGWVKVRLQRKGRRAEIGVEDSGCGMDAKFIRDRLFRPFDTTKGHGGMGIGAFESREYVRELGGEMSVASEPGVGTRIRITLPMEVQADQKALGTSGATLD